MSTVNFSQKRKRLTIGLGAILALGSVLIATERMQKGNSSSSSGSRASDPALVQYRAMAQQSFAVIQDNFGQIEKGESSSGADLAQLQNNLLSAVVPAPYQDLHLRLVGLVMKMQARGGLDINLLQEQIRLLGRDYQWLANNENSQ
jgi:hypothetical protein